MIHLGDGIGVGLVSNLYLPVKTGFHHCRPGAGRLQRYLQVGLGQRLAARDVGGLQEGAVLIENADLGADGGRVGRKKVAAVDH